MRQLPGLAGWVALLLPPLHIVALPVRASGMRQTAGSRIQASARMTDLAPKAALEQPLPRDSAACRSAASAKSHEARVVWQRIGSDGMACPAISSGEPGELIRRTAAALMPEDKRVLSFRHKCRPPPACASNDPRSAVMPLGSGMEACARIETGANPRKAPEWNRALASVAPDRGDSHHSPAAPAIRTLTAHLLPLQARTEQRLGSRRRALPVVISVADIRRAVVRYDGSGGRQVVPSALRDGHTWEACHCERREAIFRRANGRFLSTPVARRDCFVAALLAMTPT